MPEINLVQAVNLALARAMAEDANVLVLGEDVAAEGGVFRATDGLLKRFGPDRVLDTPLAENQDIGVLCHRASERQVDGLDKVDLGHRRHSCAIPSAA